MKYYSTRNRAERFGFAQAALMGLAEDGGLFIPEVIPSYSAAVRASLGGMDFLDIAFETIRPYTEGDVPAAALEEIIQGAFVFGAPLVPVDGRLVLELFHGPTAAFKDFGARFMARVFSWLRRGEDRPLHILVATSGDTGGAVAGGFFGVEGVFVTALYPRGRVSPLQERQIAGLGGNIRALAVEGSFDDCQRLVKAALSSRELRRRMDLSSANSINISRLIPQIVYYAAASGKAAAGVFDGDGDATPRKKGVGGGVLSAVSGPVVFSVPSGNFGNLTAGLYACRMGAPAGCFVAAVNANRTVPDYLVSGNYEVRPSAATISSAMDVGAPSNFERMAAHFSLEEMRRLLRGVSVNDDETREAIAAVFRRAGYFLDPHSAVGWKALDKLQEETRGEFRAPPGIPVVLATAHPAKFAEIVGPLCGAPPVPSSLAEIGQRRVDSRGIPADEKIFIELLGDAR